MWEQVQKNVITALIVTVILGIGTAILTTLTSGWLITQLGGVTQDDLGEAIGAEVAAMTEGEAPTLVTRAEVDALADALADAVGRADAAKAAADAMSQRLEDLKARITDFQNFFDGAARIIYFSDTFTVCANAGCSEGFLSSSADTNIQQLNETGTRQFNLDVGSAFNIHEPFYVLTVWSETVANEFVGQDGKPVEPDYIIDFQASVPTVTVSLGEYPGKAYMRFALHFLVAIEDSMNTRF